MDLYALTREQVKSVIEGRGAASRVPMMVHIWINPDVFNERKSAVEHLLAKYPCDAAYAKIKIPDIFDAPPDDSQYRWVNFSDPDKEKNIGLDAKIAIDDWSMLDGVLENFPNPNYAGMFPDNPAIDGRYRLGAWWFCFFERFWSLRGMTNALMDFYLNPESVHRLFRALTDFYKRMMERSKTELQLDGILTSDDIGTQTGPFFSPVIFKEFFKPYYQELIDKAHSLGMHFWMHSCGNIEAFLSDFIEIGLDVIHPIQKHTMVEKQIAEKYGRDICIWAGFDVQQTIPWGTPEDVRREVRSIFDNYFRPDGRFMITAGNALTCDCKLESLEALLDEAYHYGLKKAGSV